MHSWDSKYIWISTVQYLFSFPFAWLLNDLQLNSTKKIFNKGSERTSLQVLLLIIIVTRWKQTIWQQVFNFTKWITSRAWERIEDWLRTIHIITNNKGKQYFPSPTIPLHPFLSLPTSQAPKIIFTVISAMWINGLSHDVAKIKSDP